MKKVNSGLLIKAFISLAFISYLTVKLDLALVLDTLKEANIIFYLLSILVLPISLLLTTSKYYFLIRNSAVHKNVASLMKIQLIVRFYSLFFPSGIGREALRWYKITENKKGRINFLAIIVFERLIHVLFLLFFGLLPFIVDISYLKTGTININGWIWVIALPIIIFSVTAISYLRSPALQLKFKQFFLRLIPKAANWKYFSKFHEKFVVNNLSSGIFLVIIALHFLWIVFFTLRVYLLFLSLGVSLAYYHVAWMSLSVLLLQLLPISFAGIGIREGTYAYLMTLFSIAPEKGASLGVLFFTQMLILATIGGILELLEKKATSKAEPSVVKVDSDEQLVYEKQE